MNGQYSPFAKTKYERKKSGDPHLSIEKRYKDQAGSVQKISQAARSLVDQRYVLQEDAKRIILEAAKAKNFAVK